MPNATHQAYALHAPRPPLPSDHTPEQLVSPLCFSSSLEQSLNVQAGQERQEGQEQGGFPSKAFSHEAIDTDAISTQPEMSGKVLSLNDVAQLGSDASERCGRGVVLHVPALSVPAVGDASSPRRRSTLLLWSVWWVLAFGAHAIISNYYQTQFYRIDPQGNFG